MPGIDNREVAKVLHKFLSIALCTVLSIILTVARGDERSSANECQAHFSVEGSFLAGKKYTTWLELPRVAAADAYTRIYAGVAKDGWSIVNADKGAGIISATQSVSYSKGMQAPMTITVETADKGSKVTATFRTGGGQMSKEATIREKMCSYLSAAESQ
jgi:hypothetical protein